MSKKRASKPKTRKPDRSKKKIFGDNALTRELIGLKANVSNRLIELENTVRQLRRDSLSHSNFIASMLDLLADVLGIPAGVLNERFLFLCNEREVVGIDGKVRGDVVVTKYNF